MEKDLIEKLLKMLRSENDSDAVMGLRSIQNMFKAKGTSLENALRYASDNFSQWGHDVDKTIDNKAKAAATDITNISGVPDCRVPQSGSIEIVLSGKAQGDIYQLPGESSHHAEIIALNLKDAVVAAVINKSRFKLKLLDIKNGKGEIVETALQAEYERSGMAPIRIWVNNRGDVGALATVLRKAVANSLPELVAA